MSLFQGMKVSPVAEGDGGGAEKSLFSFIASAAAAPVEQVHWNGSSTTLSSKPSDVTSKLPVTSPSHAFPPGLSASGTTSGYSSETSSTASSPRAVTFPAATDGASPSVTAGTKLSVSATKSTRKKRHGSLIRPGYARQDVVSLSEGSKTSTGNCDSPMSKLALREESEPIEESHNEDKSKGHNTLSLVESNVSSSKLVTQESDDTLRPEDRTLSEIPSDAHPAKQDQTSKNTESPQNNQTQTQEDSESSACVSNPFESLTLDDVGTVEPVDERVGKTSTTPAVPELESFSLDLSFDLDFDLALSADAPPSSSPDPQCNSSIETGPFDGLELDSLDLQAEEATDKETKNTGADNEETDDVQKATTVRSSFTFLQLPDVTEPIEDDYDVGLGLEVESSDEKTETNFLIVGKSEGEKADTLTEHAPLEETGTRESDGELDSDENDDNLENASDSGSNKDDDRLTTDFKAEDRMDKVRHRLSSLQQRYQDLLQAQLRVCCRQVKKRQELSRIRTEQDLAVKNEDYEKAETSNSMLQSLTAELQTMTFDLPSSKPSAASVLEEMRRVMEEEVAMATEEAERYSTMKTQEELYLKELQMTKQAELNRKRQKLTTVQDQLAVAASHLSLDREHLQKSKAQLSSQVEERTAEFHAAREQLVEKRQDIQEEISALEEKLRALREQEGNISMEIHAQEAGISRVEQEFSAERAQLEEERRNIDRRQGEIDVQARQVEQEVLMLRGREERVQMEENRLQDRLQSIQERVVELTGEVQEVQTRVQDMSALPVCTGDIHSDEQPLRRLKECEQERQREVQELTTKVLRYQTSVTDLKKQLGETSAQLPVLQEAKKLAVAGYNFSEAKRLADEIKTLEDKRVGKEKDLVRAQEDLEQLNQDLETSKEVLRDVQGEVKVKEEEYDNGRKSVAYQMYKELQLQLERCTNNVVRSVLQADMTACQLLVQDICEKHHLPLPPELQALSLDTILGEEEEAVAMETSCVMDEGTVDAAGLANEESPAGASGCSCPADDYVEACENISMRLLELEDRLQAAVGEEDYDAAQSLHEEIQDLKQRLQTMLVSLQQADL